MVDTRDLKSLGRKLLQVRFLPPAPKSDFQKIDRLFRLRRKALSTDFVGEFNAFRRADARLSAHQDEVRASQSAFVQSAPFALPATSFRKVVLLSQHDKFRVQCLVQGIHREVAGVS